MNTLKTLLFPALFIALFVGACKPPDPPVGIITVVDETGDELKGAIVAVDCVPQPGKTCSKDIAQDDKTDSKGQVEFEFALPVVVRATVTYVTYINSVQTTLYGDAFVEFKEDQVIEETIVVYP